MLADLTDLKSAVLSVEMKVVWKAEKLVEKKDLQLVGVLVVRWVVLLVE
jgi:hypothetical protein